MSRKYPSYNTNSARNNITKLKQELQLRATNAQSLSPAELASLHSDLASLIAKGQTEGLDISDLIGIQRNIETYIQEQKLILDATTVSENSQELQQEKTDTEMILAMKKHRQEFQQEIDSYDREITEKSRVIYDIYNQTKLNPNLIFSKEEEKLIRVNQDEFIKRQRLKKTREQLDTDYHIAHYRISNYENEIQQLETQIESLEDKLRKTTGNRLEEKKLYQKIQENKKILDSIENNTKKFDSEIFEHDKTLESKKEQLQNIEKSDQMRLELLKQQRQKQKDQHIKNADSIKKINETRILSTESKEITKLKQQRQEQSQIREQRRIERKSATKIQSAFRGYAARKAAASAKATSNSKASEKSSETKQNLHIPNQKENDIKTPTNLEITNRHPSILQPSSTPQRRKRSLNQKR